MCILAHLREVELKGDGRYKVYWVKGEENTFEMMASSVYEGNRLIQGAGEIVG